MKNPITPTFKTEVIPVLMILASIVMSFYFYANFPDQVPTHWNYKGEVDSYSSKAFGAFFYPILNVGVYLLFLFIPYIDPKKDRYKDFAKAYHVFKAMFVVFMTLIYFHASWAGLGHSISINVVVPAAVGILFLVIGNYMSKIKTNWFMGIRTPWTLSNEQVWNKTHRLSGKIFIGLGLIMLLGTFFKGDTYWKIFPIVVIISVFVLVVYSYLLWRKIDKTK